MGVKNFSEELGPGYFLLSPKNSHALGYKYYFTGKKCPKGHISLRLVAGRACSACTCEMTSRWKANNLELYKESKSKSDKKYRAKDRDSYLMKKRQSYLKNSDTYATYREKNKEKRSKQSSEWYKRNPEVNRMNVSKRRAKVKVESDDFDLFVELEAIAACYRREEMTGYKWHVDHMIPVSKGGLHKYYNLQVIPAWMNQRKWCNMVLTKPFEWVQYLPGAEKCGQRLY